MQLAVVRARQVQKYIAKSRKKTTVREFVRMMMLLDTAKEGEFGLELYFNALCDSYMLTVMEDGGRHLSYH